MEELDKHQLAGLDNRERGFSRPVEFERVEEGYRAIFGMRPFALQPRLILPKTKP